MVNTAILCVHLLYTESEQHHRKNVASESGGLESASGSSTYSVNWAKLNNLFEIKYINLEIRKMISIEWLQY